MTRETIAELKAEIAVLSERINNINIDNRHLEKDRDRLNEKVSALRGEIVATKAERDRLSGYVDRVQESEQPEERRRNERRSHPPDHHPHHHDFTLTPGSIHRHEPKEPWYE